uniref:Very-long-chain (3R)-3-hydroxyacyl-CoA dehydratase n=1 Tax=Arundo donax TaxID=35708 RepID=A0A0A9G852_ARUDO
MAGVPSVVRRLYLSIYNWVIFFGWAQVLYFATLALLGSGHETVYAAVEQPLLFAQTAALMEILHSVVGFVRSPVSATLPQISARLFVTWGILWSFPETHSHVLVTSLVLSWSITEVIRYSFFGLKEAFGIIPSRLLWLRYSTFMVLYPTGLVSEVGLIYAALPYMKASEKYCLRMPNKWNFSLDYYYASVVLIGLYIPGFPYLFRYMLAQRKKALSKAKTA